MCLALSEAAALTEQVLAVPGSSNRDVEKEATYLVKDPETKPSEEPRGHSVHLAWWRVIIKRDTIAIFKYLKGHDVEHGTKLISAGAACKAVDLSSL